MIISSVLRRGFAKAIAALYLAGTVAGCSTPQITAMGVDINKPNQTISYTQRFDSPAYAASGYDAYGTSLNAQEADQEGFCERNTALCVLGAIGIGLLTWGIIEWTNDDKQCPPDTVDRGSFGCIPFGSGGDL